MKRVSLVLAAVLASTAAADAGTRSLILDRSRLAADPPAIIDADQSVLLSDGEVGRASLSFVLPKDFKKNSAAMVELYLGASGGDCFFDFEARTVYRARLGIDEASSNVPAETGVSPVIAGPIPAPSSGTIRIFKWTYTLKNPSGLPVSGQRAGDFITILFDRLGSSESDTCTTQLWATGGKLIYKTP